MPRTDAENLAYDNVISGLRNIIMDLRARLSRAVFKNAQERSQAENEINKQIEALNSMIAGLIKDKYDFEKIEVEKKEHEERLYVAAAMQYVYEQEMAVMKKDEARKKAVRAKNPLDYKRSRILQNRLKQVVEKRQPELPPPPAFIRVFDLKDADFANAAKDPEYFKKKREEHKIVFKNSLNLIARHFGFDKDAELSLEEQEKRVSVYLQKKNGYEEMVEKIKEYQQEMADEGIEIPEELKDMIGRAEKLAKKTRELQTSYVQNKNSFETGNGYTKELIDEEQKLYNDIDRFAGNELVDIISNSKLDSYANGERNPEMKDIAAKLKNYEIAKKMTFYADYQNTIDSSLQRNNELIEKAKTWEAYKESEAVMDFVLIIDDAEVDKQYKAISKIDRTMKKAQELKNPVAEQCSNYASVDIQKTLDVAFSDKELKKEDQETMMKGICGILINKMIGDELSKPANSSRPIMEHMAKYQGSADGFSAYNDLVRNIISTKQFKDAVKDIFGDEITKEKCIEFLAGDKEKELSESFDRHSGVIISKNAEIRMGGNVDTKNMTVKPGLSNGHK